MKTLLEKIAVMQAAADGKVIQTDYHGPWTDCPSPSWDWGLCNYRVKPREPKVIYVNEYEHLNAQGHKTEAEALSVAMPHALRRAVKYQEVIAELAGLRE